MSTILFYPCQRWFGATERRERLKSKIVTSLKDARIRRFKDSSLQGSFKHFRVRLRLLFKSRRSRLWNNLFIDSSSITTERRRFNCSKCLKFCRHSLPLSVSNWSLSPVLDSWDHNEPNSPESHHCIFDCNAGFLEIHWQNLLSAALANRFCYFCSGLKRNDFTRFQDWKQRFCQCVLTISRCRRSLNGLRPKIRSSASSSTESNDVRRIERKILSFPCCFLQFLFSLFVFSLFSQFSYSVIFSVHYLGAGWSNCFSSCLICNR